jgi:lysophospholipase L1-like esterase
MKKFLFLVTVLLLVLAGGLGVSSARPSVPYRLVVAGPQKVLIIGSSTTGCAGPTDAAHCYVNLYKAARPTDTVTVEGRGGTYVSYGTPDQNWTTPAVGSPDYTGVDRVFGKPGYSGNDRVYIQLGINDWYVPVLGTTYRANVRDLVVRARAANPVAKIYWIRTWMPAVSDADLSVRTGHWNDGATQIKAALTSVSGTFLDLDPTGQGAVTGCTNLRADPTSGWHYNDVGHVLIKDKILSTF